ncbi:MAG: TonB family protein [Cyanobacteria bacterium J06633_8]
MSFASAALKERERESKALEIFIACSLTGSLIFHLALLASGIGKYLLNRVPSIEEEPVEITLLDTPIEEIEPESKEKVKPKLKPEPKKIEPKLEKPEPKPQIKQPIIDTSKIQPNLDSILSQSQISGGSPALSNYQAIPTQPRVAPQPPSVAKPLPKPNFKPFKQFKPIEPVSPVLPSAPTVAVREKPVIPKQKPEPEIKRTARRFSTPVEPPKPVQEPSQELKDLLAQERDSRRRQRDFSTPVNPPIEPPTQNSAKPDEGLKDLLAQERDSRRRQRDFSTPVNPPIEPPTQNLATPDEGLKDLLVQERNSRRTQREFSTPVNPPIEPPTQNLATPDEGLKDLLIQERNSRRTARSFSTPVKPLAPSSPDTSNIGGIGDNAPRRRRRIFSGSAATAPTNTNDNGTGNNGSNSSGDSIGDGDGRAACRRCDRKYPSWARKRSVEGSITVSVNADAAGNVTNVQLISGSGNSKLDKHHLRIARKWKLKPSSNGRKRVTIVTRYQLQ